MRSTSENADIFTARDEIYLVFVKKSEFLFILYSTEIQKAQPNFSLVVSRSIWLLQCVYLVLLRVKENCLEAYFNECNVRNQPLKKVY